MHPWFRPPHRRVLTIAFCLAWLAYEAWADLGSPWFWVALAFTVYGIVLVSRPPGPDGEPAGRER